MKYNFAGMDSSAGKVRDFFDAAASRFDSLYGHSGRRGLLARLADRTLRRSMLLRFQEVLRHTAKPEIRSVLDVGCGPGRYCLEFLKQGKTVTGLDLSSSMLTLARSLTGERVRYVQADYLEHPFEGRFDAACLMGFFDYVQDPVKIFEKLKKEVAREIYASFPEDAGPLAWQRKIRYRLRRCPLYLYSREQIDRIMAAAGLADYEVRRLGRDYFVKVTLKAR